MSLNIVGLVQQININRWNLVCFISSEIHCIARVSMDCHYYVNSYFQMSRVVAHLLKEILLNRLIAIKVTFTIQIIQAVRTKRFWDPLGQYWERP